jgi:hypothetical protein
MTMASKSTLARDRIFALCGLATDGYAPAYKPDYVSALDVVIKRFARKALETIGVTQLDKCRQWSTKLDCPSWAPSLEDEPYDYDDLAAPLSYSAGGILEKALRWSDDDKFFIPSGFVFDKIIHLSDKRPSSSQECSISWYLHSFELMLPFMTKPYHTGESPDEVVEKTALADRSRQQPKFTLDALLDGLKTIRAAVLKTSTFRETSHVRAAQAELNYLCQTYQPFVSEQRYLGLVPHGARVGDRIACIRGAGPLFVLREDGGSECYRLQGQCYVHGLMDGQQLSWSCYKEKELWIW